MNEQELRAIVRSVVQRVHGPGSTVQGSVHGPRSVQGPEGPQMVPASVPFGSHARHFMYLQLVNDNGGQCLIEPKVPCNHCGYCQSHGH